MSDLSLSATVIWLFYICCSFGCRTAGVVAIAWDVSSIASILWPTATGQRHCVSQQRPSVIGGRLLCLYLCPMQPRKQNHESCWFLHTSIVFEEHASLLFMEQGQVENLHYACFWWIIFSAWWTQRRAYPSSCLSKGYFMYGYGSHVIDKVYG